MIDTHWTNLFDPKLFAKIYLGITLAGAFLIPNFYTAYDASQSIKYENTLEEKISKASKLKKNIKEEDWFMKPILLGEHFTAKYYLNKYSEDN